MIAYTYEYNLTKIHPQKTFSSKTIKSNRISSGIEKRHSCSIATVLRLNSSAIALASLSDTKLIKLVERFNS